MGTETNEFEDDTDKKSSAWADPGARMHLFMFKQAKVVLKADYTTVL